MTNAIAARLDDFRGLGNGWLDGCGLAPGHDGLDWLARCFGSYYPDVLPPPHLYPTAEGGVQAEWSLGTREVTLKIDLERRAGEWHSLDVGTHADDRRDLDLTQPTEWAVIAEQIDRTRECPRDFATHEDIPLLRQIDIQETDPATKLHDEKGAARAAWEKTR